MLSAGTSVHWSEALFQFTEEHEYNATALLAYFKPLTDWLTNYNQINNVHVGWTDDCPLPPE